MLDWARASASTDDAKVWLVVAGGYGKGVRAWE
jgi:hypothetical protein